MSRIEEQTHDLLITADTIVLNDKNEILEKPIDKEENINFIKQYSNSYLITITATCLDIKTNKGYKRVKYVE